MTAGAAAAPTSRAGAMSTDAPVHVQDLVLATAEAIVAPQPVRIP